MRVTESDTLNDKTFGRAKTIATFTTSLAETPALALVDSDGEAMSSGVWYLSLADDGQTLKFGAARGTQIILR